MRNLRFHIRDTKLDHRTEFGKTAWYFGKAYEDPSNHVKSYRSIQWTGTVLMLPIEEADE